MRIPMLVRDHSRESREAERALVENHIEHATLYALPEYDRLPFLLCAWSGDAFTGLGQIRFFVRAETMRNART